MRTGIVVTGIIILILGMFLSLMWYPMFGYASASETAAELEDFDFNIASFNGKDVKFSGTVDEIYTDDIPGVDFLFELIDISIITIVDLEVDTLLGGSAPVFIICDNTDISDGDTVIIEGIGINYGGFSLIFGEDVANAVLKLSSYRAPDPATVKSIPMPEFYIGIVILIVGLIIAIISGNSIMPCPMAMSSPANRLRAPIAIAEAVTGPGASAPESDITNTCARKNNNSIKSPTYSPMIFTRTLFFLLPSNSP